MKHMATESKKPQKSQNTSTQIPSASQWLDMLKEKEKLTTDLRCAEILNVSKQTVSHWRQERFQIGIEDSFNLGEALQVNPLYIILCAKYHSAKNDAKDKWVMMISKTTIKKHSK